MKRAVAILGALTFLARSPIIAADTSGYKMPAVKIAVADYQRSIDFYSILGLKVGEKYNAMEQQLEWNDISQGASIVLMHDESGKIKLAPGGAFLVFIVPDMKKTVQQLRDAGNKNVGEPRDMKTAIILITKDPDGNTIELVQLVAAATK